ncbi:coenzyme F420-0:L-glutamate ligase [Cryobacterium arcticum]|uniref:Oxidoreductase n=1 Tax=Cryobacterium arcticum TaxID=670052 RepID=A0A1B1BPD6_9MICO|nr:oxidoreductase [Cryobacterium arcticum]
MGVSGAARPDSRLEVFVLPGIGEIRAGDDLAAIILAATGTLLADGDILAVTSKIVSKAEGRQVAATDREQAITDETVRVVATRAHPGGVTRIVENRQGLVMAAAGVDASNVTEGTVLLLPVDPDASARALCTAVREATGLRVGVLITDTVGRPWRDGQTDIAIGAAGVAVLDDLRGTTDAHGRRLDVTVAAVADEIAGAADLIKGKTSGNPVAVVRGLAQLVGPIDAGDRGARRLLRDSANDMFRVGSAEAYAEGYAAGLEAAATREIPSAESRQSPPSELPTGHFAATRETPASDLPVAAPSDSADGPEVATRGTASR